MFFSRPSQTNRRKSSTTPHYQTFPVPPPKNKGRPPSHSPPHYGHERGGGGASGERGHSRHASDVSVESPLPKRQLAVLAIIALCEQTALNSISPYLPQMASTFPEVDDGQVGLYVGLIASSFALAQFATNFFWGWLSDRIGRKPVILMGTLFTAASFIGFGFSRTLWQAVLAQVFMGTLNGNQGVVSTCLGEITDRSNQSQAFAYLPVIYGIGGITGPLLGGLLVGRGFSAYPYLAPNLFSSCLLVFDLIFSMIFMEESLEEARNLPPLGKRVVSLFTWVWQFSSSSRPSYLWPSSSSNSARNQQIKHKVNSPLSPRAPLLHNPPDDAASDRSSVSDDSTTFSLPALLPENSTDLDAKHIFKRDTMLLLVTYLIFQLSNISYNSLYPIFAQAEPPAGRNLSPEQIGLSLSFAGAVTIAFQIGVFGKLREKLGNKVTYRVGLGGFVLAFVMMPFVGYKEPDVAVGISSGSKAWLWAELGFVLLVKTVATVGGLTSALLLVSASLCHCADFQGIDSKYASRLQIQHRIIPSSVHSTG